MFFFSTRHYHCYHVFLFNIPIRNISCESWFKLPLWILRIKIKVLLTVYLSCLPPRVLLSVLFPVPVIFLIIHTWVSLPSPTLKCVCSSASLYVLFSCVEHCSVFIQFICYLKSSKLGCNLHLASFGLRFSSPKEALLFWCDFQQFSKIIYN